jgi:hypothetical protein
MIFCREVPVCSVLDAAYREHHISKWNYEITEVQFIHISSLGTTKMAPRICYFISISKVYIWDLGLSFCKFAKSFVETFTPYNQILIFGEKLCMSNVDFYL